MALTLGDNFSYQGAKPLDARLKYDTLVAMKAVADATMYDGCMAYCSATDKTYQWKSTNTVDESTGKWREFSSGGGGGSTYTAGDGIAIDNDEISIDPMPAEDMDDVIDELPTGGNIAVTGYVPLGTLIPYYGETAPKFFLACDGSTYNKADYPELAKHLLSLTNNTPYIVDGDNTKFKVPDLRGEFIRGTGSNGHADEGSGANVGVHQDGTFIPSLVYNPQSGGEHIQVRAQAWNEPTNIDVGIRKTTTIGKISATVATSSSSLAEKYKVRPTNTSVLFCIAYKDIYSNPMNDYSTDEKVVGTWIDNKPIYQRTYQLATALSLTSNTWVETNIPIGNMGSIINCNAKNGITYSGDLLCGIDVGSNVRVLSTRTTTHSINCITLQYTKTTD